MPFKTVDFEVPGGPSSITWRPLNNAAKSIRVSSRRPTK
jgi:hypothetical protein